MVTISLFMEEIDFVHLSENLTLTTVKHENYFINRVYYVKCENCHIFSEIKALAFSCKC